MSIRECQRCAAVSRTGKRCKRTTCRTDLCYQHLQLLEGLRIKKSSIQNAQLGLFAAREFRENDNVARYTGLISEEPIEGPYVLQINQNKFIDANKTSSSAGRFANDCRTQNRNNRHCRGNNSKFSYDYRNERANLKAKIPIHRGDEIFASYSRGYWN